MTIESVKRLAADILDVGINKIRIKPEELKKAEEALTRSDVRALIKDRIVYAIKNRGRRKKIRKRKRGAGNIKGRRANLAKRNWMIGVRSQRAYLKKLIESGAVSKKNKKIIYGRIKGGLFKSKRAMLAYLKDNNLVNEEKLKTIEGKGSP